MTKNGIRKALEDRGYWLAIEGRTYTIFREHRLIDQGDKGLAEEYAVEPIREEPAGYHDLCGPECGSC